ncbi:MAG TPA: DUF192 domain-containing protein [Gammaproteobacteria bacterium]|nr:DUF192 domain-containing protein [Gammaproteobacteria bacterium]
MKRGALRSGEKGRVLVAHTLRTENALERMRGLLARRPLEDDEALWIEPCPSVHTLGMRYAIDVVFIDHDGRVRKVVEALKPFRFAACRGARTTVELAAGVAGRLGIEPGMVLAWQEGKP